MAAGVQVERTDDHALTPMLALLAIEAPAEAIRTLLDAGANPTRLTSWSSKSIEEIVDGYGRDYLDFLIEAHRGRR